MAFDVTHPEIIEIIRLALAEDIGSGDITTDLCVPADVMASARMVAREPLTLAAVELLPLVFEGVAPGACVVELRCLSGAHLNNGDEIAFVRGPARALLTGERVALNFVQRLSGVATVASKFAKLMEGTRCRVLDTRKTTPGLRRLEKQAVAAGGGVNHRVGLFDAVLIKNNHITIAGGVRAALDRTKEAAAKLGRPACDTIKVEIEVRTRAELEEALACGAQHLLLDNLTPAEAAEWIVHIDGRATVELSGGISLSTARAYAETGADFISSGAITHSAGAVDINFRLQLE